MFYLFKDLVFEFGEHALIGHSETFKDIYFAPPNYSQMLIRPYGRIEKKDHDFVIGTSVEAVFTSSTPPKDDPNAGEPVNVIAESPFDYADVAVSGNTETHRFDIPAVAIECKTYLDKTMLESSSRSVEELKARNSNGMYLIVMEWIKLAEVNLRKYKVDQIYVLRKQKNTDREFRYLGGYKKNPIDTRTVSHLFEKVRRHLTRDWEGSIEHGIQRGWLIEE